MDDGLKQRMIGAMVLLALGIIFLPAFFDRERVSPVDRSSQIPTAPAMDRLPDIELSVPEQVATTPTPEQAFLPEEPQAQDDVEEQSDVEEQNDLVDELETAPSVAADNYDGAVKSWVLQFASYRDKTRAQAIQQQLIKAGHTAYLRDIETRSGIMTRVYIGPKINKQALVQVQQELNERYGVKTLLMTFEP